MIDEQTRSALEEYQYSQNRVLELTSFIQDLHNKNRILEKNGRPSKKKADEYIGNLVLVKEAESLIKFLKLRIEQRKPILKEMV